MRAIPLSQSVPTANTHELSRVVTTEPLGAPEATPNVAFAPIAPEPLLPLASAPVNATTVIDAAALCAKFAVTAALVKAAGANARQISASPGTLFARATICQVSPAPLTDVTELPPDGLESVEINANRSSFAPVVENCAVEDCVPDDERSAEETVSMARREGAAGELTVKVAFAACDSVPLVAVTVSG